MESHQKSLQQFWGCRSAAGILDPRRPHNGVCADEPRAMRCMGFPLMWEEGGPNRGVMAYTQLMSDPLGDHVVL